MQPAFARSLYELVRNLFAVSFHQFASSDSLAHSGSLTTTWPRSFSSRYRLTCAWSVIRRNNSQSTGPLRRNSRKTATRLGSLHRAVSTIHILQSTSSRSSSAATSSASSRCNGVAAEMKNLPHPNQGQAQRDSLSRSARFNTPRPSTVALFLTTSHSRLPKRKHHRQHRRRNQRTPRRQ